MLNEGYGISINSVCHPNAGVKVIQPSHLKWAIVCGQCSKVIMGFEGDPPVRGKDFKNSMSVVPVSVIQRRKAVFIRVRQENAV